MVRDGQIGKTETDETMPAESDPNSPKKQINPAAAPDPAQTTVSITGFVAKPVVITDRPEWPLIEAVRHAPWDAAAIHALADWYRDRDPPRNQLIHLQLKMSQIGWRNPAYAAIEKQVKELLDQHGQRWMEPLKGTGIPLDGNGFKRRRNRSGCEIRIGLIDDIRIEGLTDAQLAVLTKLPEIRELWLDSPKLTEQGFELLTQFPQLDKLWIFGIQPTGHHFAILASLPCWTHLRLRAEKLNPRTVNLINAIRIPKIEKLDQDRQYNASVRFLSTFDGGSRFGVRPTELNLIQAGMTDVEMRLLKPLTDLTKFYISESRITEEGIAHLAGMKDLRTLGLFQTRVNSLGSLKHLRKLESLEIFPEDAKMGDEGLEAIENFAALTDLYIHYAGIGDGTVKRLAGLKQLRNLDIMLQQLNDPQCLSALEGLTEMRELKLEAPEMPGTALEHLAGMKHLEQLEVDVAKDTDRGLRFVGGLDQLKVLVLRSSDVSDQGIQQLARLTHLETFVTYQSRITRAGAEELASKLPHVTIIAGELVVKSPRDTYKLIRQRMNSSVSLLIPYGWFEDARNDDLSAKEEGWNRLSVLPGGGPARIHCYLDKTAKSPDEATMDSVNNNAETKLRILERDVVKVPGLENLVSCICQKERGKFLIVATAAPEGIVVLSCETTPSRFNEFRKLFIAIATSLRCDPKPEMHLDETVEIPAK